MLCTRRVPDDWGSRGTYKRQLRLIQTSGQAESPVVLTLIEDSQDARATRFLLGRGGPASVEVREHGVAAAVFLAAVGQSEFLEDRSHVGFDGSFGEHELRASATLRTASRKSPMCRTRSLSR